VSVLLLAAAPAGAQPRAAAFPDSLTTPVAAATTDDVQAGATGPAAWAFRTARPAGAAPRARAPTATASRDDALAATAPGERGRRVRRGALTGALVGVAGAVLLGAALSTEGSAPFLAEPGFYWVALRFAGAGALVGAALGALSGP
jgi:hypothetical protein